jgi:hypothetical protein
MKYILVGYNQDFSWIKDYTDDYLVYDRSETDDFIKDIPKDRVIKTENVGNADYDKLNYLVDNYDNLPEVFLWGKTNLFKYITKEEFEKVKDNKVFTPLLTQNHKTYSDNLGVVCYYSGGIYHERNPMIYSLIPCTEKFCNDKYCKDYPEFAFMFQLPCPFYIPFAPGGNYILTKDRVHRYSRDFYKKMADILPYCAVPLEAYFCERAYYQLWC